MFTSATFSNRLGSKPVTRRREERERGMAVMLTGIMLLFIIPAVGLAIDAGVLYVIRGRLTAACDAASLATARNLNLGMTLAEQSATAIARGENFFYANFPNGYLGTSGTTPVITLGQTNSSTLTVTTTASTNAPLYFMRILGGTSAVAGALGRASRRDVNLMLVLDRSGSMAGAPCASMINAAKNFVNMFVNGRDTLGMVNFSTSTFLAYPPTRQFKAPGSELNTAIDAIACTGGTNSSDAYWTAYQQLRAIDQPLALNLIVFFTDGVPTAFTARFPVKTVADVRYGSWGLPCFLNAECNIPRSTCIDDNGRANTDPAWGNFAGKVGVAVATVPESAVTGATVGLMNRFNSSASEGNVMVPAATSNGCAFGADWTRFRQDVAFIPANDINGVSTTGIRAVTSFSNAHVGYPNRLRPDMPVNLAAVATNLADNAASSARNDQNFNITTYTIGLDGNGGVDAVLLRRMANDAAANNFDPTKQEGLYIHVNNANELNAAFARVASEVLRLTQ
jgi:Flp pilus assembly protein TadG